MDYGKLLEEMETIEEVIWGLKNLRGTEWEDEAAPLMEVLERERARLRMLIAEEEERQREALCREYERNAL